MEQGCHEKGEEQRAEFRIGDSGDFEWLIYHDVLLILY